MSRSPFTTPLKVASACLLAQFLIGCATNSLPKPRGDAAAVVLEVTAVPKTGAKAHRFTRLAVYDAAPQPAAPSGQFELVDYSSLNDVIVWLEPAGAGDAATNPTVAPPPPTSLVLDVDSRIHPEDVRAVAIGQELVFRNRGAQAVSIYSVSDDNEFELPAIPPGGEARHTVRGSGLIELLADPSDPPVAMVYAAPSPWVARTRSGGRVVFDDVTPGTYEVVSWHPRLPGTTAPVSLAPGAVANVALNIGVNVLAEEQP